MFRGVVSGASRRFVLLALAITLLGGVLRVVVLESTFRTKLVGDEFYYRQVAQNIAIGDGHVMDDFLGRAQGELVRMRAWRPPAQAYFLAAFIDAGDLERQRIAVEREFGGGSRSDEYRVVRPRDTEVGERMMRRLFHVQAALGTVLVLATAFLARALFGDRVGLVAASGAALDPTLVAYSHYLWSETLFALLVTLGLLGIVRWRETPSFFLAVVTGVVFGLATLTRELALPVAGMGVLWWLWTVPREEKKRALAGGALCLAAAAAVFLPWTWRNYRVLGRFVPVSTIGWFASGEGNTFEAESWLAEDGPRKERYHRQYFNRRTELERTDFARSYLIGEIAAEQPTWILEKLVRSSAQLLTPDSYLFLKIREGAYGDPARSIVRAVLVVGVGYWVVVLVLGALGVAGARANDRRLLALLVLGVVLAIHVVANSASRFRVPWLPFGLAYAGYALLHWRTTRERLDRRGLVLVVVVLGFFFAVCVPLFRARAVEMWTS